jgi:hypothetical protein
MVNYYNSFLKNASAVLAPLYELLKSDVPWRWNKKEQEAFKASKLMLQSSKLLVHYNPSLPLILSCDASPYGLGAVLSHEMPDGTEKPVAYASRTLTPSEKNYAQIEREGLSIIFGVTKFHKYVYGRKFTIRTDHKPLLGLISEKQGISATASARIQRWSLMLSNYSYHLDYKPGSEMANADGLSRLPLPVDMKEVPMPGEPILSLSTISNTLVTAKEIAQWTARDPILSLVVKYTLQGWPPVVGEELMPYFRRRTELSLHDKCLLWGNRVIIPPRAREAILEELHTCHPGIVRMKSLARSYLWWPGLDAEIEAKVRGCNICQQINKRPPSSSLHPWEWPGKPWFRIHVDFAGPFEGKMILVITDSYSKYIDAHIMASASSAGTIQKLRQTFATHGLPVQLVSDNGTCFTSAEFGDFCKQNGIKHTCTAPYHPSSNGLAERAVQTLKNGLRKSVGDLEDRLCRFLLHYRATPQSTTNQSPAELLMGRRPRTRLDLLSPNLQDAVLSKQATMKDHHDPQIAPTAFFCGDAVWAMNMAGTPKWLPGVLEDKTGPVSFLVRLQDDRVWRRHADHLRHRLPRESTPNAPEDDADIPRPFPALRPTVVATPAAITPIPSADSKPEAGTPASPTPMSAESAPSSVVPLRRSQRTIKPPDRLTL